MGDNTISGVTGQAIFLWVMAVCLWALLEAGWLLFTTDPSRSLSQRMTELWWGTRRPDRVDIWAVRANILFISICVWALVLIA